MKTKEQKNCEKIQSENTVNIGDFFENPNNPSKATPEQLERLAEKLKKWRPETLAQASHIPGVNPADIAVLSVIIHRGHH